MRILLLWTLLLILLHPGQNPATTAENFPVEILSFKFYKTRQVKEKTDPTETGPVAATISGDRNAERNRRANPTPGERDPYDDTVDARSAALERSVQESRAAKPVDGFAYRAKVQNASAKVIEILFWEYQFVDSTNPAIMSRRQFLCAVNIKPAKEKEIQAFSLSGSSDVVSVGALANKAGSPFQEKAVINRVEYADGTIWQRKDWSPNDVRLGYERALRTPWGTEMCRSL